MFSSRAINLLQRSRHGLLLAGLLLLVLGMRIYVGVRNLVEIPQADDGATVAWLQKWSQGLHDWSFVWRYHNRVHPMDLFYLSSLAQYKLNGGFWDGRVDFLVFCFVHTIYAGVAFWTFGNLLTRRDRWWIYLFVFVLFAVPFAGYRVAWGMVWVNTAPLVFALPVLYLVAYRGQSWSTVVLVCLLSVLAALNTGAGCLCALMVVGLTLFEAAMARRITNRDLVMCGVCLVIFLAFYLQIESGKRAGLVEAVGALLKALAWPAVFVPGAGLFTVLPLIGLVAAQIFSPRFRGRNVSFLTGVSGLTVLIAVATGALRGDNNNMGMPSGRYVDLFLILPLITALSLCLLYRGTAGRWRTACVLLAGGWLGCQFLGFAITTVYRIIPFAARETGEWNEAQKQVQFRRISRGEAPVPRFTFGDDETLGLSPEIADALSAHQPPPAMTTPMIAGFDLQPGSEGNCAINGYHPSYQPWPAGLYRGSFDFEDWYAADRWFTSGLFRPQADYVTLDMLMDKKARFTNYRLDGLRLTLVDVTAASRTELLPKLAHTYPFVLRDWEMVYAKVTPGHDYRIEFRDSSPSQWLAFSEPLESGRLTPLVVSACQSGKLLCLAGLGLLGLVLYLRWLENEFAPGEPITRLLPDASAREADAVA